MDKAVGGQSVRIGCGAGFSGDRLDAAGPVVQALIDSGGPAYLVFETLAERTLALAQLRRRQHAEGGYFQDLPALLGPILARCQSHRIPIIGNFGAADPLGAAQRIQTLAREVGCPQLRIAAITGDDMFLAMDAGALLSMPRHPPMPIRADSLVSANVYLGADGIAAALAQGADVVVTGRVADPALVLGALVHHFGWRADDWDKLAAGVLAGHLLECGAQVTGGYFADPGFKDVPNLAEVGYPICEVEASGDFVVTKPRATGGCVTLQTVKEQMLYEIHDPAAYLTPDVVLDLTGVRLEQQGADRVRVSGARGRPRPQTLKATVCFDGGHMGEGEISYAGPNARARGLLAIDILRQRLAMRALPVKSHFDLIGVASVFNGEDDRLLRPQTPQEVPEVRVRMAVSAADRATVLQALNEVDALYTCGPTGGGGVRTTVTPLMISTSVFADRATFQPVVTLLEPAP
ncbi:MAG: acyclic terpene utilization AtuA family protein [Burkholderiaceae bacterium]